MSLRLHEVGPRITFRLYKIEEAVLTGNVVYNRIVKKSKTEMEKQRKLIMKKRWEKMQRKTE
jgi:ribosome biogenesis protein SSF1/2